MVSNQTLLNSLLAYDYDKLKADLEANCREDALKSNGKPKNKLSILKRLNKDNDTASFKNIKNSAIACKYGFAFLNSYMMLFSNSDFGYENKMQGDSIEIDNRFLNPYEADKNQFVEITLTDDMVADIRVMAKEKRSKYDRKPYVIQYKGNASDSASRDNCIGLDPKKLIDVIDFTGSYTVFIAKYNAPVWLEGDTEKAMLLPVNIGYGNENIEPNAKFVTLSANYMVV